MSEDIKVSVSILCADFARLADQVKFCEDAGADLLHIDVMDGHFVPNITIGPLIVRAIRPLTKLPLEAHLMIENPGDYLEDFLDAGADIVSLHAECYGTRRPECRQYGQYPKEVDAIDADKARADLQRIRQKGGKAVMVLNPGTPLCLESVLKDLNGVLVMSVNPGFAKQKFMPSVLPKIQQLRNMYDGDIAIDGGINDVTGKEAVKAGANVLSTASYFFGADKPREAVLKLKGLKE